MSKSKQFAEKLIDSMVDESGHCGERSLSRKQFDIISQWLDKHDVDGDFGCWHGDYKTVYFTLSKYTGRIGKYEVTLHELWHFNARRTVKSIVSRRVQQCQADTSHKVQGQVAHANMRHPEAPESQKLPKPYKLPHAMSRCRRCHPGASGNGRGISA